MTNRINLTIYTLIMAVFAGMPGNLKAMEDVPVLPQISLVIDAPFVIADFPVTPLIGVYATPYNLARPLVTINSRHLLAVAPESVLRALATVYGLSGSSEAVRNALNKYIDSRALHAWLMVWQGLATTPAYYNAVFHQIVGEWLGKQTLQDFHVHIAAGLFEPQGIQGGDAVIPFNGLGALEINRHSAGIDLSPDNGRFYPMAGRNVIAFWLIGADKALGRAVVSYNLILVSAETRNAFMEVVDAARYAATSSEELAALVQGLQDLVPLVKKEDQDAIAGVVDAIAVMQATQLPAEEKKAQAQPKAPAKKPALETKRARSASQETRELEETLKLSAKAAEDEAATQAMIASLTAPAATPKAQTAEEKKREPMSAAVAAREEKKTSAKPKVPAKKPTISKAPATQISLEESARKAYQKQLEDEATAAYLVEMAARDAALVRKMVEEEASAAYLAEMAARELQAAEENAASEAAIAALVAGELPA